MTTVYTTSGCMPCKMTKKTLKKYDIQYVEYNIENDEERRQEALSTGFISMPIVVTDSGEKWCGFRVDKLKELADSLTPAAV
jgi:nrdH family redoxin